MRTRWLTRRAFLYHLLLIVIVPLCVVAGWWQLHQALSGNTLSWAYTVEWPVFAVIACVGWWQLIHEDQTERAQRAERAAQDAGFQRRIKRAGAVSGAGRAANLGSAAGVGEIPVSWRQAAIESYESDGRYDDLAERVAAAARQEYRTHLAKLADSEDARIWRNARGIP